MAGVSDPRVCLYVYSTNAYIPLLGALESNRCVGLQSQMQVPRTRNCNTVHRTASLFRNFTKEMRQILVGHIKRVIFIAMAQ